MKPFFRRIAPVLALLPLAAAAPGDPIEVDLVKLTSIDWEQGRELPADVRALDGREVAFTGYLFERFQDDRSEVLVVADSCQCSGTPLPHHFVKVSLGEKTRYRGGELSFLGTFSVGEETEDGFVTSLFRLKGGFL